MMNAIYAFLLICILNELAKGYFRPFWHLNKHRNNRSAIPTCLSDHGLEAIRAGGFRCDIFGVKVSADKQKLGGHCHTQGVGLWNLQSPMITTCQEKCRRDGVILSYTKLNASAVDAYSNFVPPKGDHPSATQVWNDYFPVAFAQSSDRGPTEIRMFVVTPSGKLYNRGAITHHQESHIGALAFIKFDQYFHMIGCGWDCSHISFWKVHVGDEEFRFKRYLYSRTSDVVKQGIDRHVGPYNSLFLSNHCETEMPLLFATHGEWLDIWQVQNLGTVDVFIKKIVKRRVGHRTKWGLRSIFMEGVTLVPDVFNRGLPIIIAAPHDYNHRSCPYDFSCSQFIYQCRFSLPSMVIE